MSDTSKRKFRVRTGSKSVTVVARSPYLAALYAVSERMFQSLGILVEVRDKRIKSEADGTYFISSIRLAKEAGLLKD